MNTKCPILHIQHFVQTLKTCNCKTTLCNRNWVEAGSTEGPGPTDSPTEPAVKTIKVRDNPVGTIHVVS